VIARSAFLPEAFNQTFNIGGDRHYSVNQVAQEVFSAMGVNTGIRYLPMRQEVKHIYSSHEKIRSMLGLGAKIELKEGIERMVRWARQHGARQTKEFTDIEIERNLPESWRPVPKTVSGAEPLKSTAI